MLFSKTDETSRTLVKNFENLKRQKIPKIMWLSVQSWYRAPPLFWACSNLKNPGQQKQKKNKVYHTVVSPCSVT